MYCPIAHVSQLIAVQAAGGFADLIGVDVAVFSTSIEIVTADSSMTVLTAVPTLAPTPKPTPHSSADGGTTFSVLGMSVPIAVACGSAAALLLLLAVAAMKRRRTRTALGWAATGDATTRARPAASHWEHGNPMNEGARVDSVPPKSSMPGMKRVGTHLALRGKEGMGSGSQLSLI